MPDRRQAASKAMRSIRNSDEGEGMGPVKDVAVRFESGRDVLSAYWGYLSDGGLMIPDDSGLDVGLPVSLRVRVESVNSDYLLSGKVVRRHPADAIAVIAFDPGEPHDMLLTHALAEADNVPARRHPRYRTDLEAVVENGACGEPVTARVINVSRGGCCLRLEKDARDQFSVGSRIAVAVRDHRAVGEVVWVRNTDRGVSFGADRAANALIWAGGSRERR